MAHYEIWGIEKPFNQDFNQVPKLCIKFNKGFICYLTISEISRPKLNKIWIFFWMWCFLKCKFLSLIKRDHLLKIATSFAILLVGSASDCQVRKIYIVYTTAQCCVFIRIRPVSQSSNKPEKIEMRKTPIFWFSQWTLSKFLAI